MADMTAELEKEADKIRSRLAPKREEIRADEEQLARLEAAIDVLKGNVALASRPARSPRQASSRTRGSIDEEAIIGFVRSNQPVGARDIGEQIGVTGNRLSVKLGRMVQSGVLTKTGERRGTRYSAA